MGVGDFSKIYQIYTFMAHPRFQFNFLWPNSKLRIFLMTPTSPYPGLCFRGGRTVLVNHVAKYLRAYSRILCHHNSENQMDKCVEKERVNCIINAETEINQTSGNMSLL